MTSGFPVYGPGFPIDERLALGVRVQGSGFRVHDLGSRV